MDSWLWLIINHHEEEAWLSCCCSLLFCVPCVRQVTSKGGGEPIIANRCWRFAKENRTRHRQVISISLSQSNIYGQFPIVFLHRHVTITHLQGSFLSVVFFHRQVNSLSSLYVDKSAACLLHPETSQLPVDFKHRQTNNLPSLYNGKKGPLPCSWQVGFLCLLIKAIDFTPTCQMPGYISVKFVFFFILFIWWKPVENCRNWSPRSTLDSWVSYSPATSSTSAKREDQF